MTHPGQQAIDPGVTAQLDLEFIDKFTGQKLQDKQKLFYDLAL